MGNRIGLRRAAVCTILGLLVGCASGSLGPIVSPTPGQPIADPAPSVSSGPAALLYGCRPGLDRCEGLAPGTYVTAGEYAFLTGLTVTVPAGWSSAEQDAGEFELHREEDVERYRGLAFWRDMVAWVDGRPAPQLGTTADDLVSYLLADPRLDVTEEATRTFDRYGPDGAVDGSVTARSVTVMLAEDAPKEVAECPGTACADFLGDPYHWGPDHGVGILRGFVPSGTDVDDLRAAGILVDGSECPCGNAFKLHIAQLGPANVVIASVGTFGPEDPVALAAALVGWEHEVEPILASTILPWEIVAN
jgi:hypothetical protein